MKIPTIAALISFGLATFAQADQQLEQLKAYYKAEGDALFVPLYWLPETRQTVLKHIPDHDNLTERLLNTPETQRYQCFSRLFARLAEIKAAETKPDGK